MSALDRTAFRELQARIAAEHGLTRPEVLLSQNRQPAVVRARDHFLAVVKWSTGLSLKEMRDVFGMDHTSILTAIRRHEARLNGEFPTKREAVQ